MPAAWDTQQYLKFENERTLPSRDLVRRIALTAPARVLDLGCGPGTSTAVLCERWPRAEVVGLDSSEEMLQTARRTLPGVRWVRDDLRSFVPERPFDLVFSNAVLHWVPDHPTVLRRIWEWVAPGGALAFQVPARDPPRPPWVEALADLRSRPPWRGRGADADGASPVLSPAEYYEVLAPGAKRVDLWDTVYVHVLAGPGAVVEWVKGTALRSWLEVLTDEPERRAFLDAYQTEIARRYPLQSDGNVLFPFQRRFVIAYR